MVAVALVAWAGAARAEIPLPEHPRPDWERSDWVNMNGMWDFGFAFGVYDRRIFVPFGWGSPLSGVVDAATRGGTGAKSRFPPPGRGIVFSSLWARRTMIRKVFSTGACSDAIRAAMCRSPSS